MSYAAKIIAKLGGTRCAAAALSLPPSTVQSWKKVGRIPAKHLPHVLATGLHLNKDITPSDFFDDPSAPPSLQAGAAAQDVPRDCDGPNDRADDEPLPRLNHRTRTGRAALHSRRQAVLDDLAREKRKKQERGTATECEPVQAALVPITSPRADNDEHPAAPLVGSPEDDSDNKTIWYVNL